MHRIAVLAALLFAFDAVPAPAADTAPRVHGIAMHGEPKYGPDFTHFDYVNPDAPKGGLLRLDGISGTFDSFNAFNAKGTPASAVGLTLDTLMVASADEPFTKYGLLAESFEVPEDRSWITFHLRPEARWHDGNPITAEDVAFTFKTLVEKGRPLFRFYYQSVTDVAVLGTRSIKFTFAPGDNRELPLILGEMPVLPKHYWEDRDFTAATLSRRSEADRTGSAVSKPAVSWRLNGSRITGEPICRSCADTTTMTAFVTSISGTARSPARP